MKITALEEYGLRCLLQLARVYKEGLSISEIAVREGLSIQYVSKITAQLRKGKMVESTRGVKGGYRLIRSPKEIRLSDVMKVLGGPMFDDKFCLSHAGNADDCVHENDCSVRSVWQVVYMYMSSIMEHLILADLLDTEMGTKEKVLRIIADQKIQLKMEDVLKVWP